MPSIKGHFQRKSRECLLLFIGTVFLEKWGLALISGPLNYEAGFVRPPRLLQHRTGRRHRHVSLQGGAYYKRDSKGQQTENNLVNNRNGPDGMVPLKFVKEFSWFAAGG
jgi:hypothetical protein